MSSLVGLKAWKPVRTYGSMFFIDIGVRFWRRGAVRDHGEWCLLVEKAEWTCFGRNGSAVFRDSALADIDKAFADFHEGIVTAITLNTDSM